MDYKNYSLKNLENWVHDAISCEDTNPQEIYDTIKNVVDEQYQYYTHHANRCRELLSLLNGTNEHVRNDVLKEREYYEGSSWGKVRTYPEMIADGWEMTADGFWINTSKQDKKLSWVVPVELDGLTGECYVNLPDDLLEAANLKEGDEVEFISNQDNSISMIKVNNESNQDRCGENC